MSNDPGMTRGERPADTLARKELVASLPNARRSYNGSPAASGSITFII